MTAVAAVETSDNTPKIIVKVADTRNSFVILFTSFLPLVEGKTLPSSKAVLFEVVELPCDLVVII